MIDELKLVFSYDPVTGTISRDGEKVGKIYGDGYVSIYYDGRIYYGHRLAWALFYGEWPSGLLDHRDRNRSNNAIKNLRLASHSQNRVNSKVRKDSKSGLKGVYYCPKRKRWFAYMRINGRKRGLGGYPDAASAASAVHEARQKLYPDFACES